MSGQPEIVVDVLYPDLLNLYGDRGNARALVKRCEARGITAQVRRVDLGDAWDDAGCDIVLVGGGQDREQRRVESDLLRRGQQLRDWRDAGGAALAVCGGYQLFGRSYRGIDGELMEGIGVFDMVTIHPGPDVARCVGNVAALWEGETLVGFENHGGRSYLNEGQAALADVVVGFGNNGGDGGEGARANNCFGTYLHGAVLPNNPRLADRLISLALERRGLHSELEPLEDRSETRAHAEALNTALRGANDSGLGRALDALQGLRG